MDALLVIKCHHYRHNSSRSFSFHQTIHSLRSRLILPLRIRFPSLGVMLSTYSSPLEHKLYDAFSPKFFFSDSESHATILTSFHSLLCRLRDLRLCNTFIVISRFDIIFKHRFQVDKLSTNHFNSLFLCKDMAHRFWTDDNLIAFPATFVPYLLQSVEKSLSSSSSGDYHSRNLHWLFAETSWPASPFNSFNCLDRHSHRSDSNPYFYLHRGDLFPHRLKPVASRLFGHFRRIAG